MSKVRVAETFAGSVHEAESCWYDTDGWSQWVDGLATVLSVDGQWPEAGASVIWQSGPAGRGHVTERVVSHEPLAGQSLEVRDDSIEGRQSVTFTPAGEDVEVDFALEYQIRRRTLFTPLVDALFIRRAMASSMRSTLARFGVELAAARSRHRPLD